MEAMAVEVMVEEAMAMEAAMDLITMDHWMVTIATQETPVEVMQIDTEHLPFESNLNWTSFLPSTKLKCIFHGTVKYDHI